MSIVRVTFTNPHSGVTARHDYFTAFRGYDAHEMAAQNAARLIARGMVNVYISEVAA